MKINGQTECLLCPEECVHGFVSDCPPYNVSIVSVDHEEVTMGWGGGFSLFAATIWASWGWFKRDGGCRASDIRAPCLPYFCLPLAKKARHKEVSFAKELASIFVCMCSYFTCCRCSMYDGLDSFVLSNCYDVTIFIVLSEKRIFLYNAIVISYIFFR